MNDEEDIQLKTELDEISRRIDTTLRKIETLFESDSEMTRDKNE